MTRFARAKGSKASNEKAPEDATPWEVMKDQLLQAKKESEEAKNRQAAEQQRIENYENFLKDRRVQKIPATWCDFPEAEKSSQSRNKVTAEKNDVGKKKKSKRSIDSVDKTEVNEITDKTEPLSKKKKKNKKSHNVNDSMNTSDNLNGELPENSEPPKNKKMKDKQKGVQENEPHKIANDSSGTETKSPKKNKNKQQSVEYNVNNDNAEASYNPVETTEQNNFGKQINNKKNKGKLNTYQTDNENNKSRQKINPHNNKNVESQLNKQKVKKKKNLVDGQPVRRKEINDKSFQYIIGGKEVELVRYDGFPIMKKDAERLAELKDSMIKKGIPKSEVQRTMKLERRRAEKALARMRREVCYNCRKGGHNLSDCPELKSKIPGADAPEGVCFKCGSTEHRQFECKVQRDKEFRFATCFICKEPGHIARQCPDNPKGLYPNGGSCKLCGDVTHLRKDCPTANNKKEETSVKLQTLDNTDDIEGIGAQNKSTVPSDTTKKPKKIRF